MMPSVSLLASCVGRKIVELGFRSATNNTTDLVEEIVFTSLGLTILICEVGILKPVP